MFALRRSRLKDRIGAYFFCQLVRGSFLPGALLWLDRWGTLMIVLDGLLDSTARSFAVVLVSERRSAGAMYKMTPT